MDCAACTYRTFLVPCFFLVPMPKIGPVDYRKLVKVFEKKGFVYQRTTGDHLIYTKSGILRPIVIPKYKQIPPFIVLKNLRTAEMTREEYLDLLKAL